MYQYVIREFFSSNDRRILKLVQMLILLKVVQDFATVDILSFSEQLFCTALHFFSSKPIGRAGTSLPVEDCC